MKTNAEGETLIKDFEKLRLKAYLCPAGVPTISYGCTRYTDGSPVRLGDTITKEEAEKLFNVILGRFEKGMSRYIKIELNENQFSALVSFAFNVGVGNFKNSTLLRKINSGDLEGASKEFERWIYSNGKKLRGLIRRREAEKELFLT
ncbi:lysozyme [uncultured Ilyobacter sp.]|uniref:lysozyme n=1 Tax=uncultured Ilyobacter sp. TaxID=544433 RepID=UPI0029C75703|nr:lysozyme [uncultured Ilyobacter sp.]